MTADPMRPGPATPDADEPDIRPMRPEDVPACLRLLSTVFGSYADHARFDLNAAFGYAMGYPPSYLVAWVDGRVAGLVGAIELWRSSPRFDIVWLAVAAEHRGRGLGRQLMRACLADLPQRGIVYVETETTGFYARCGFREIESTDDGWRLMSLHLPCLMEPSHADA